MSKPMIGHIEIAVQDAIRAWHPHVDWLEYESAEANFGIEMTPRKTRINLHVQLERDDVQEIRESHTFGDTTAPDEIGRAILARLLEIERASWRGGPESLADRVNLVRMAAVFEGTPAERLMRHLGKN